MKLQTTSGRVSESSKTKGQKDSPGGTQVEPGDPGGEADTLAVSRCINDASNVPKKLREALERVREHMERKDEEDSPGRLPDLPHDLHDETAVPNGTNEVQEGPKSVSNERVDATDAPGRDRAPGGHRGEQEAL